MEEIPEEDEEETMEKETMEVESILVEDNNLENQDDLYYVVVDESLEEPFIEEAKFEEDIEPIIVSPYFHNITDANEFELALANYMMNECVLYQIQRGPKKKNADAANKRDVEILLVDDPDLKFDSILNACYQEGLNNEDLIGSGISSRLLFEISSGLFNTWAKKGDQADACSKQRALHEAFKKANSLKETVARLTRNLSAAEMVEEKKAEKVEVPDKECEASKPCQNEQKKASDCCCKGKRKKFDLAELKLKRERLKKNKSHEIAIQSETVEGYRGDIAGSIDELLKFIDPEEYSLNKTAKNKKIKKPPKSPEKPQKRRTKKKKEEHEAPKNDEIIKLKETRENPSDQSVGTPATASQDIVGEKIKEESDEKTLTVERSPAVDALKVDSEKDIKNVSKKVKGNNKVSGTPPKILPNTVNVKTSNKKVNVREKNAKESESLTLETSPNTVEVVKEDSEKDIKNGLFEKVADKKPSTETPLDTSKTTNKKVNAGKKNEKQSYAETLTHERSPNTVDVLKGDSEKDIKNGLFEKVADKKPSTETPLETSKTTNKKVNAGKKIEKQSYAETLTHEMSPNTVDVLKGDSEKDIKNGLFEKVANKKPSTETPLETSKTTNKKAYVGKKNEKQSYAETLTHERSPNTVNILKEDSEKDIKNGLFEKKEKVADKKPSSETPPKTLPNTVDVITTNEKAIVGEKNKEESDEKTLTIERSPTVNALKVDSEKDIKNVSKKDKGNDKVSPEKSPDTLDVLQKGSSNAKKLDDKVQMVPKKETLQTMDDKKQVNKNEESLVPDNSSNSEPSMHITVTSSVFRNKQRNQSKLPPRMQNSNADSTQNRENHKSRKLPSEFSPNDHKHNLKNFNSKDPVLLPPMRKNQEFTRRKSSEITFGSFTHPIFPMRTHQGNRKNETGHHQKKSLGDSCTTVGKNMDAQNSKIAPLQSEKNNADCVSLAPSNKNESEPEKVNAKSISTLNCSTQTDRFYDNDKHMDNNAPKRRTTNSGTQTEPLEFTSDKTRLQTKYGDRTITRSKKTNCGTQTEPVKITSCSYKSEKTQTEPFEFTRSNDKRLPTYHTTSRNSKTKRRGTQTEPCDLTGFDDRRNRRNVNSNIYNNGAAFQINNEMAQNPYCPPSQYDPYMNVPHIPQYQNTFPNNVLPPPMGNFQGPSNVGFMDNYANAPYGFNNGIDYPPQQFGVNYGPGIAYPVQDEMPRVPFETYIPTAPNMIPVDLSQNPYYISPQVNVPCTVIPQNPYYISPQVYAPNTIMPQDPYYSSSQFNAPNTIMPQNTYYDIPPQVNAQDTIIPQNTYYDMPPEVNSQSTSVPEVNSQSTSVPEVNSQSTSVPQNATCDIVPKVDSPNASMPKNNFVTKQDRLMRVVRKIMQRNYKRRLLKEQNGPKTSQHIATVRYLESEFKYVTSGKTVAVFSHP